jgi:tryptophan-rich sensory protein
VVQAWSKILNKKKAIHAYLVEIIIGFIPSNLCTYIMQTSSNSALLYLLWFVLASITKKGEIEREIGLHLFLIDFGG